MIPAPRNILVSYHYFRGYDLNRFAGLRVIGDSGAFSALHQGAEITTAQLAAWADKWRHRLCWVAALDVIGDAEGTRRNWHEMVDGHGIPGVPTVHFGAQPNALDYFGSRGVDFVGLGGLVGRPAPAQMRWLVSMFKYQRDAWPDMRFHGWGITHAKALQLPFFSVDSSGWGGGYRYGRLSLRDPNSAKTYSLDLDGRTTYEPGVARLLRDHYGVNPSEVATSSSHNRLLMVRLSALSASVQEQQFRRLHRRNPVPAPTWGRLSSPEPTNAGPHYHLAGTGQCRELTTTEGGPHLHLAIASRSGEVAAVAPRGGFIRATPDRGLDARRTTVTYPVVLLSGGMDSTTLLATALDSPAVDNALAVFVDYGQRHVRERESARLVATHYGVSLIELDLRAFGASVKSALTVAGANVPHGHYAADNMALTVVPNRNATLLSAAAGIAASNGCDTVMTAVHAGDHAVYNDCRPEFIEAISRATELACGVAIRAPFVDVTKAGIAAIGARIGVPYRFTWSCYEGGEKHCGRCGTCVERAEAFHDAGVADPTDYADATFWREAVANA